MAVGNLEFIKSASGPSVSSIEITNCFSDKYDVYLLDLPKMDSNGASYINLRFLKASDGSPDTTASYDSAGLIMRTNAAFGENKYTGQTQFVNSFGSVDGGSYNNGGTFIIYNPFSSSSYSFLSAQMASYWAGDLGWKSIGVHKVAQSNSGIQIIVNSDYIQASIFGVK